jgi:hypothetical protein
MWTSKRVQATLQAMAWQVRSVCDMLVRLQADSATGVRSAAGGLALQVELIRDAVRNLAAATLRRALKLHRTDPALAAERALWCELQVCGPFLDTAVRALSTAAEVQVVRPPAPECAAQRRYDARRQRGRPP